MKLKEIGEFNRFVNDLNERDEITFNVTKKPSFKDGVVKYKYNAIDIKFGK